MGFRVKTSANSNSKGGRIFLFIFGGIFFLIGSFFFFFLLQEAREAASQYSWNSGSCQIIDSGIEVDANSDDPFTLRVKYRAAYPGGSSVAETHREKYDDYSEAYRKQLKYTASRETSCYYNPENKREMILERTSLWFGLLLLFPLIFVAVGAVVIYSAFSQGKQKPGKIESISKKGTTSQSSAKALWILFGVFFLVGLGTGYPLLYLPVKNYIGAQSWKPTQAKVIFSKVRSHQSDDGTTYSVDIFYSYDFNGRQYKSNRYKFIGGSSSGYTGKREVVRNFPRGRSFTCYVNPSDPIEAVIEREPGWEALLMLIPLVFLGIGAPGLLAALKKSRSGNYPEYRSGPAPVAFETKSKPSWLPGPSPKGTVGPSGEYILAPAISPVAKVIGMTFFAIFWNGIVSVFLFNADSGFGIFTWVFMTPFVLVGLVAIAGIFYFIIALKNPRPKLILDKMSRMPGEEFRARLKLDGTTQGIKLLKITLSADEAATYRRGTDTVTDTEEFYQQVLFDGLPGSHGADVEFSIPIPESAMHSFEASNNKILWKLNVHADIPRWPDIKESFPLIVTPLKVDGE